jgi:hypothetical protein
MGTAITMLTIFNIQIYFKQRTLSRIKLKQRIFFIAGGCRKLHDEELHNLFSSQSIIRLIKSRRRWVRHVVRMVEERNWWETHKERDL